MFDRNIHKDKKQVDRPNCEYDHALIIQLRY